MPRTLVLVLTLALAALSAAAAEAAPQLERVVVVVRHGVRPPTSPNDVLRPYSAEPWPAWPVAAGNLTPHGAQVVALMGRTLRAAYAGLGVLPKVGCSPQGAVTVWADGADERTQMTGVALAASLEGGCPVDLGWKLTPPLDPIFGGATGDACQIDTAHMWAPLLSPPDVARLQAAYAKLQYIFAPDACHGGPGACFTGPPDSSGLLPKTAGFAEDMLLEYAEGMKMENVGWGRARRDDLDLIMTIHELAFGRLRDNTYAASRRGAAMTRVIMAALQGQPIGGGPAAGPDLRLLGLAGHDTNLVLMAGAFGLKWKLPDQPDSTAPATALAFELWRDGARRFVRAVVYYQKLDQMRALAPALGYAVPLRFEWDPAAPGQPPRFCDSGPMRSCPLADVQARIDQNVPAACGWPPGEAPAARKP